VEPLIICYILHSNEIRDARIIWTKIELPSFAVGKVCVCLAFRRSRVRVRGLLFLLAKH
jgi:hypothetical protein